MRKSIRNSMNEYPITIKNEDSLRVEPNIYSDHFVAVFIDTLILFMGLMKYIEVTETLTELLEIVVILGKKYQV